MEHVEELISLLVDQLESSSRTDMGQSRPRLPMVLCYGGEKAAAGAPDITAALRRVWRARADAVCQLMLTPEGFRALSGEPGPLEEGEAQDRIDAMFAREDCFRDMSSLFLCTLVSTGDCSSLQEFIRLSTRCDALRDSLPSQCLYMNIIFLDESARNQALAQEVRRLLHDRLEQGVSRRTVVVLSSRMKNGVLLAGERIRENWSLAACLLLLVNSAGGSSSLSLEQMFPMESGTCLTAACCRRTRPNREICEILISTALAWLQKRLSAGEPLSRDRAARALGISGGSIEFAEEFFKTRVRSLLPDSACLECFPRREGRRESLAGLPFQQFDQVTMGSFRLFYRQEVQSLVTGNVQLKSRFRSDFREWVSGRVKLSEAAASLTDSLLDSLFAQISIQEPKKNLPAHSYMTACARRDFLLEAADVCLEELRDFHRTARSQLEELGTLIREFQHVCLAGDDSDNLRSYYEPMTRSWLEGPEGERLWQTLNSGGSLREGILSGLAAFAGAMFAGEPIFRKPLEEEMTIRMGSDGGTIQARLQKELTENLTDKTRLATIFPVHPFQQIFMMNQRSADGSPSTLYTHLRTVYQGAPGVSFFDTGSSDALEVIQLCRCSPEALL